METTEEKKCCEPPKCSCYCRAMTGVFIVLIGITVLLGALEVLSQKAAWIISAILVILIGLKKICAGLCKRCDKN